MSGTSDPTAMEEQDSVDLLAPAADLPGPITASVDFAHLVGDSLLVYGWIVGPAEQNYTASIQVEDVLVDLTAYSKRFRRPDVSQHFSTAPDEEHGFYLLLDLRHPAADVDWLLLSIALLSGETHESRWTILRHDPFRVSIPQSDLATLRGMLRSLPALDRMRLARFLAQDTDSGQEAEPPAALPSAVQFEVDFCCVLDGHILVVYGWLLDPAEEVLAVELGIGNEVFDILNSSIPIPRLDISPEVSRHRGEEALRPPGFILVQIVPTGLPASTEATFAITARNSDPAYLTRPLCWNVHESRSEILGLVSKMDVATGMLLIERILSATRELPGMRSLRNLLEANQDRLMERLPSSIQFTSQRSRYWLHLDHAIPVASTGIFLSGWSYAEGAKPTRIFCHCGEARFSVSASWIRHVRSDVTTYLEGAGIQANGHEHGFTCDVPLPSGHRPYWLSMISESGDERRMHIPAAEHEKTAMQTVRSLLGSFHCEHRELRALLDRQVGPAVEAAWTARQKPPAREIVERFGAAAANPEVSIIVPLYGRWDFAEYQMSQFAIDPSFRDIDLIYVVDDPSIYDAFRNAGHNLFGVYEVPFTIVFSGTNMGFAGANNFGAAYARGRLLLLLNSDVLPKQPGWLREMLRVHGTLSLPGVLGVKLLYEDGTLQHAGIEFRRHAPWGGLWINDHPLKGTMPNELEGTREAPAVTAACALIEADLYRELNGLSEDYIIGDFEDSDLCLRARQAGRKNYVALDIELYHLERQSQNQTGDALWRANLTAYNCWLHNKRWSESIEEIAAGRLSANDPRPSGDFDANTRQRPLAPSSKERP